MGRWTAKATPDAAEAAMSRDAVELGHDVVAVEVILRFAKREIQGAPEVFRARRA